MRRVLATGLMVIGTFLAAPPAGAELPTANTLVLAGIAFDDKPLQLPVTDNFQTALNAVAGDLGKHCTKSEAYGWRLLQTEQERVNTIFSAAAEKLQTQGYSLTPQNLPSTSREITVFTARKGEQDVLMVWSAGELGLVLLACEPLNGTVPVAPFTTTTAAPPAVVAHKVAQDKKHQKKNTATKAQKTPMTVKKAANAKPTALSAQVPTTEKAAAAPQKAETIPDLPPVIRETPAATPTANPADLPAATPNSLPPVKLAPEVEQMLQSLPEKPAAAPTTASPSLPTPPDQIPAAPAPLPTGQ